MTPQERHQDAVEAAREWRDEQRALPREGDKLVIHWPNGPDFHMELLRIDDSYPETEPGWLYLHGIVGYTEPTRWTPALPKRQTLYARPIGNGEYEMKPKLL